MGRGKILVVEDSKTQSRVLGNFLTDKGYDVRLVENGRSAIRSVKTDAPDLVLLDYLLPDINGDEVCRFLKLDPETKDIPIIMLTVKGTVPEKVTGLEAGADDYIPKPFDEIELNARIYACLRTKALQDELKEKNCQLKELPAKVETLAITDPLTNIYNRRHFLTVLDKEFRKTERYGTPLSCTMIDIDHFKKINDDNGHHAGDQVLQKTSKIIRQNYRGTDIVARWGGEEFIVLLPQTDKDAAADSASRMLQKLSSYNFSLTTDRPVTASIGVAVAPSPDIDSDEKLLNAADMAMYRAKKNGRNRIETA